MADTPQLEEPPASGVVKLDVQNPWPGPAAYDEASHHFFYGRTKEATALLRLVRAAPLTVLYGKSGLGKSSLLQAGLFPQLRAEHFLPIYVRLDFTEGAAPPLEQVKNRLGEELRTHHADHPAFEPDESLWEYLHRAKLEIWSQDNFPLVPVVVLDQFEELFSRSGGKADLVQHVLDSLADLIENRIPAPLAAELEAEKRARLDLFAQNYRVLLSFREDFLPVVRTWETKVPSLLRSYLRIEPLSRANAVDAVECPGKEVLLPGVAGAIVDFVAKDPASETTTSNETIEPVLLSLCCARLNGKRAPGARIDESLIDSEGQGILDGFYKEALADDDVKGPPDVASFIEGNLIQGNHFRGDYPKEEALVNGLLTPRQLAALTDKHRLLRVVPHPDTARIELIHDRLVPVVRAARDARKARREAETFELEARQAQERAEEREQAAKQLHRLLRRTRLWAIISVVFALAAGIEWRRAESARKAAREQADQVQKLADLETFRALTASAINQARLDPELATLLALRAMEMAKKSPERAAVRDAADVLSRVSDMQLRTSRKVCESEILNVSFVPRSRHMVVECRDGLPHEVDWPALNDAPPHALGARLLPMRRSAPTGKQLGYLDGLDTIRVLDADSGREEWSVVVPQKTVNDFAFSPDGKRLAAAGATVWIWRQGTTTAPLALAGHVKNRVQYFVSSLAFSHSGALLATGGHDNLVRLWDVKSGREVGTLDGHTGSILSVEFSLDDKLLVSGSVDGTARVWDVATKRRSATLQGHANSVFAASFSEDGRKVVTGSADGTVRLWDADSGRELVRLAAHGKPVQFARFVDGDRHVVSAGWDGYVRTWSSGGHTGRVNRLRFSADDKRVVTASSDGTVRLWDAATGDESRVLAASRVPLSALALSAKSSLLATGDTEGCIRIWDMEAGKETADFPCKADVIADLDFSPNDLHLAAATTARGVQLWDLAQRTMRQLQLDTGYAVTSTGFSLDGRWIASTMINGALSLHSASEPAESRHFELHTGTIFSMRFSSDSSLLLTTGLDRSAKLTDVQTGEARIPPLSHVVPVMDGVFAAGGSLLITATLGGDVIVWNAASGAKVRELRGHAGQVQLALSEDGSRLATFGWDRTARVWDTSTWEPIAVFTHDELVDGGAISRDGTVLATFTPYDVRIIPIAPEALIRLARSRVSRVLTSEECKQYLLKDCGTPAAHVVE